MLDPSLGGFPFRLLGLNETYPGIVVKMLKFDNRILGSKIPPRGVPKGKTLVIETVSQGNINIKNHSRVLGITSRL